MLKKINLLRKDISCFKLVTSLKSYSTKHISEEKFDYDVIVIGGGHAGCEAGNF